MKKNRPISDDAVNRKEQPIKLRFGIKTMLAVFFLVSCCIVATNYAFTDTIFRSNDDGLIELPNGMVKPLNKWFRGGSGIQLDLLATEVPQEYLLVEPEDSTRFAKIELKDGRFEAIVNRYKFRGPKYKGEFWIQRGKKIE